jgi:hypothetical protein
VKSRGLQPRCNAFGVVPAYAKAIRILLRAQPVMIESASPSLLLAQQFLEILLLSGRPREVDAHARHRLRGRDRTCIPRLRYSAGNVSVQKEQFAVLYTPLNPIGNLAKSKGRGKQADAKP